MIYMNTVTMIVISVCERVRVCERVLHQMTLTEDTDYTVLLAIVCPILSNSSPKWFGQCLYSSKAGAPKTHLLCVCNYTLLLQTSYSNTVNSLCFESCVMAREVWVKNVRKDIKMSFLCLQLLFFQN